MTDNAWVLCLGVPDLDARRALETGRPAGLGLVHYEDSPVAEQAELLHSAPAILAWSATMNGDMVRAAVRTTLIQKIGEGTDKIDVAAADAIGVPVAKTAGVNATSCAELTVLLMLATLRNLPAAHQSMVDGRWDKWKVRTGTRELRGKRVGIIGLGKIGLLVASRVRAFDATVVYFNRTRLGVEQESAANVDYQPLQDLLRTADVVSLHVPLNASSHELIGAAEIAAMKHSAILINTARGDVVDEAALIEALRERRIAGAGIDVYADEPPAPDHPLRALDNVVLTPHVGGVTDDSRGELIAHAFRNISAALEGRALDPADLVSTACARRAR